MKSLLKKNNKGFTIIEVLIVLAIAGLIILIVFLAVPALQRNSRNTQVREDASKSLGIMQESINNNNGSAVVQSPAPPTELDPANAQYSKVSVVNYGVSSSAFIALPATLSADAIYIRNYSTCDAGGNGQIGVATGGTQRQVTATFLVESPGTPATAPTPADFAAQCIQQ